MKNLTHQRFLQSRLHGQIEELGRMLTQMKARNEQFHTDFKSAELELDKLELMAETVSLHSCSFLLLGHCRFKVGKG